MSATVTCPTCNGEGTVADDNPELPCEATIKIGHETIDCYATRQHKGFRHMAILCDPCPDCGGYDECAETCPTYLMEPQRDPEQDWWSWADSALALRREAKETGRAWRDEFQPDSPWARKKAA